MRAFIFSCPFHWGFSSLFYCANRAIALLAVCMAYAHRRSGGPFFDRSRLFRISCSICSRTLLDEPVADDWMNPGERVLLRLKSHWCQLQTITVSSVPLHCQIWKVGRSRSSPNFHAERSSCTPEESPLRARNRLYVQPWMWCTTTHE